MKRKGTSARKARTAKRRPRELAASKAEKAMNEQDRLGFVTALGEEFCTVFDSVATFEICPQNGYEVFSRVLGSDFDEESLRSLKKSQIADLRSVACKVLECTSVTDSHVREVIRRTLRRWR